MRLRSSQVTTPPHAQVAMVSLRVITGTAALRGAPVDRILTEFGLSPDDVRDDRRRVPWETMVGVVHRLGEAMGREPFIASGVDAVQTLPDFAPLAQQFVEPFSLLRFVCEVANQAAYPMITLKVDMLGALRFNVRMRLAPGYPPSELVWAYFAATLAAIPAYCGLPPAVLTATHTGHASDVILDWPPLPTRPLDQPRPSVDAAMRLLDALGVSVVQIFNAGLEAHTHAERAAEVGAMVQQLVMELQEPAYIVGRDGQPHAANGRARAELRDGGAEMRGELARADDLSRYAVLPLLDDQRLVIRRNAAPVGRAFEAARGEARALRRVVGLLPMPVAVLDTEGTLLCTSLSAERLMASRSDIHIKNGKLTSARTDEAASIAAAIRTVAAFVSRPARRAVVPPATPRVVELSGASEQPLGLLFVPLSPQPDDDAYVAGDGDSGGVLVVMHDPAARVRLSPVLIASLHGLTPVEAEIAAALAEGSSAADVARDRGCANATVRSHLKRILEKTGTHRQADLVRVLLSGAAMHLSRLS